MSYATLMAHEIENPILVSSLIHLNVFFAMEVFEITLKLRLRMSNTIELV
jgi:hypothetical protein